MGNEFVDTLEKIHDQENTDQACYGNQITGQEFGQYIALQ